MRILTRYIAYEFTQKFFLGLAAFTTIYLVVEFFERINALMVNQAPLDLMIAYFTNKIPFIVFQIAPSAILLSCLLTLGFMSKYNEILAMKSGGIPLRQISAPILTIVGLICIGLLGLSEFIIPLTNASANQIWDLVVHKKKSSGHFKQNQIWIHGQQSFYNIQLYHPASEIFEGITIFRLDPRWKMTQRIDARRAQWENGQWVFSEASVTHFAADGSPIRKYHPQLTLSLPETPKDLKISEKNPEEMTFRELREFVKRIEQGGYNASKYQCAMHSKISFPFVGLIMAILGIPIGLRKEKGAGLALALAFCILLSFAYLLVFSLTLELGKAERLPPFWAAWLGNVIFALVGTYLFLSVRH